MARFKLFGRSYDFNVECGKVVPEKYCNVIYPDDHPIVSITLTIEYEDIYCLLLREEGIIEQYGDGFVFEMPYKVVIDGTDCTNVLYASKGTGFAYEKIYYLYLTQGTHTIDYHFNSLPELFRFVPQIVTVTQPRDYANDLFMVVPSGINTLKTGSLAFFKTTQFKNIYEITKVEPCISGYISMSEQEFQYLQHVFDNSGNPDDSGMICSK